MLTHLLISLGAGVLGGAVHHALTLRPGQIKGVAKALDVPEATVQAVDQAAVTAVQRVADSPPALDQAAAKPDSQAIWSD